MGEASSAELPVPDPALSAPDGKPRRLLTEGVLLALSPAVAYAVALAFEAGYGSHFGYTLALIDVSFRVGLLAWAAILTAALLALLFAINVAYFIPLRSTVQLVRVLYPGASFLVLAMYCRTLFTQASLILVGRVSQSALVLIGRVFCGVILIFALLLIVPIIAISWRDRRKRPLADTWQSIADGRKAAERPWVRDNVLHRTLGSPQMGQGIAQAILCILLASFAIGAANRLGRWTASGETLFLTFGVNRDSVALRRFPQHFIVARFDRATHQLEREYRLLPTDGPQSLFFAVERLGGLSVRDRACAPPAP